MSHTTTIILLLIPFLILFGILVRENLIAEKKTIRSQKILTGIVKKKIKAPIMSEYDGMIFFDNYVGEVSPPLSPQVLEPIGNENDLYVESQKEEFIYKIIVPNDTVFDSFFENQRVTVEIQEILSSFPNSFFKSRREEKFIHWELFKIYKA